MEVITVDKWYSPWPEPVTRRPDPAGLQASYNSVLPSTTAIAARWYSPWPDPVWTPRRLAPQQYGFMIAGPLGINLAEAVHVQWLVPWPEPVRRLPPSPEFLWTGMAARVPPSPPATNLSVASGSFAFSGSRLLRPPPPPFDWSNSYTVPAVEMTFPLAFSGFDVITKNLFVQFRTGFALLYGPVSYGFASALMISASPLAMLQGVPLIVGGD